MPDSYPFEAYYSKHSLAATYIFSTSRNLSYRVYFIEVTKIIEIFDEYPVLSNGMYMGIELVSGEIAPFDWKTGLTVSEIVRDYLAHYGKNTIFIYNCDEKDGKQARRSKKFHRWNALYLSDLDFEIYDKEILEENEDGVFIAQYLTLMYFSEHVRIGRIRSEIAAIEHWFDDKS